MWRCTFGLNCLTFYNGGKRSGASQPHKHAQLVPLPLGSDGTDDSNDSVKYPPIHPLLEQAWREAGSPSGEIISAKQLPFLHWFSFWDDPSKMTVSSLQSIYDSLCNKVLNFQQHSPEYVSADDDEENALHYSLLLTRNFILIVPRKTDSFRSISVNSLGFAGSLFVKSPEDFELIKQVGPMNILKYVSYSTGPSNL